MSFKIKNRKKKIIDNRITIDAKHNNKVNHYNDIKKNLINLNKEFILLKKELSLYNNKNLKDLTNEEYDKKDILEECVNNLKKKIYDIKQCKEEKEYYINTSTLLFDYYSNNNTKKKEIKKKKNSKTVMDWLNKDDNYKENIRKNICDSYLSLTDPNFVKKIDNNEINSLCNKCNIEKIIHIAEGNMICTNCGEVSYIVIDSDKPSYKDPPKEISYFAYKRINHFNEWLAQFQAKETTDIPKELYDQILIEIKKERIDNMCELKQNKIRDILKKLKQNKYYEHIPHIINKINGLPPPIMSRETEEKLRRMFKEIQIPFQKFCPKDRKNFLSYSYVLHKFVQLLDLDEYLHCFLLLKSREKLHQQDIIWEKICHYLKWEFIPSV